MTQGVPTFWKRLDLNTNAECMGTSDHPGYSVKHDAKSHHLMFATGHAEYSIPALNNVCYY